MDLSRISPSIDVRRLLSKSVTLAGCGGGAGLASNLVRCGVDHIRLVDKDMVSAENICRQEHMADQIGMTKVEALAANLRRINPGIDVVISGRAQHGLMGVQVDTYAYDFCGFTDAEIDRHFGDTDVFVFATDSHKAQARGNEVALRLGKPAVFIGLYPFGVGGEVYFWRPGLASCYRCMLSSRYAAQEGKSLDPPSFGATVLDVCLLDSIAAMVTVGLLTRGADNRFGRLIEQLGDRQFLQVKIDPAWTFAGRDIVREQLQVPVGNDAFFSFCTIARRDPDPGGQCPDCVRFRTADLT